MASIDYQEARKEINNSFLRKDTIDRKIVFWYDPTASFKEDILNDTIDFCRLLVCDKNEFEIKKIIEIDDKSSDILVYCPFEKPADINNWLLDILMYSEEYYADTVALTMRSLGLTNNDLRKVIEKHTKFFESTERIKRLSKYIVLNDSVSVEDFKLSMMAVLSKATHRAVESILTELVFDDAENTRYNELVKFGFEDDLWDLICRQYNYDGDQKINILTKRFMFTAMLEQKAVFEHLPSFYKQYIIEEVGKTDAKYFIDRIKLDKRYIALQQDVAHELKIDGLISAREISSVQEVDIFECIDAYITQSIVKSLCNASLDYDTFEKVISNRLNSIWYGMYKAKYDLLLSAISFFKQLDKPLLLQTSAVGLIKQYTEQYYKVDLDYRHICLNYRMMDDTPDEFMELMIRVENTYQERFLNVLGREFSQALENQGVWEFIGINSTMNFYQNVTKNPFKKLFVIVSDALRYEIGQEINETIKADPILKGSSGLSFAVSPIPSETRFGMASLLPHKTMQYVNKSVCVDNQATNSVAARNLILKAKNSSYAAISFEEINGLSRNDLRAYMADKSLVYIYHNTIDVAGEHNESKVFEATETAINEILSLIKKLYNNLQVSNFYITADHGFIYRENTVYESQKYSNIVSLKPTEVSKRYLITDDDSISIPYTTVMNLMDVADCNYRVISPLGYDLFKTQGGGLQYIHGGMSLQEVIVPVIHISELRSSKLKDSIRPVGVRLKSVTRKVTNRSFSLDFEQYEKVEDKKQAITCETYFVDEENNIVSGVYRFIVNSSSDDASTRVTKIRFTLKNIEFDRNKRYFLMLRNVDKSDEYIAREMFTIDILGFKLF